MVYFRGGDIDSATVLTVVLALALADCGGDRTAPSVNTTAVIQVGEHEWFTERAQEAGLDFVHFNGMSGKFYLPEILPPGVGLLDHDNDGDLDVYLVQGQMLGVKDLSRARLPPSVPLPLKGRLYRNDLKVREDGTRALHFTDVTDESGIDAREYGMGVATGDINNDGWVDLYLTNFGPNQMFRNNGDGTFTEVSRLSGTDDPGFSVSASFVDYDRDGWLDLFVGNYVHYGIETDATCTSVADERDYCPPRVYRAQPSRLYRNNRDGTFTDVTTVARMAREFGRALGVATADFNNDRWIDIFVANDGDEDLLWMNQGNGTFKNTALLSGVAVTAEGKAEGSMGVDAGDFDNDGDEDLFITELNGEGSNLYVNDGSGIFDDQSARSGLGPSSLNYTGFGTAWFDFDNDGWLDLLAVNGTVFVLTRRGNQTFPHDQRKLLFHNLRNGRFEEVSAQAGTLFQLSEVGRGAAFGDVDNDGDVDVVVGNDSGRTRLLINNVGSHNHWLGLRLVGAEAPRPSTGSGRPERVEGRDMLGARVEIIRQGRPSVWRRARADGSYASANDARVLAGLGTSTDAPRVRVHWPGGRVEDWGEVAIDRYVTLKEGGGR